MLITFLGVRGSMVTPGARFARYGGETSCVAVAARDGAAPTMLLDAGSGIRSLGTMLGGTAYRGAILLSHLHWDHMLGLPFCPAADRDDAQVRVVLPAQDGKSGYELLAGSMSPPWFPIGPAGLRGHWRFDAVEPGIIAEGAYRVRAAEVAHKGGRAYGYRVERDGATVVYVPDHVPSLGVSEEAHSLLRGADVLIHDAQFLGSEATFAHAMGHSSIDEALELARSARVGTLVLFHHSPSRTDDELDAIAAGVADVTRRGGSPRVVVAAQGDSFGVVSGRTVKLARRQQ